MSKKVQKSKYDHHLHKVDRGFRGVFPKIEQWEKNTMKSKKDVDEEVTELLALRDSLRSLVRFYVQNSKKHMQFSQNSEKILRMYKKHANREQLTELAYHHALTSCRLKPTSMKSLENLYQICSRWGENKKHWIDASSVKKTMEYVKSIITDPKQTRVVRTLCQAIEICERNDIALFLSSKISFYTAKKMNYEQKEKLSELDRSLALIKQCVELVGREKSLLGLPCNKYILFEKEILREHTKIMNRITMKKCEKELRMISKAKGKSQDWKKFGKKYEDAIFRSPLNFMEYACGYVKSLIFGGKFQLAEELMKEIIKVINEEEAEPYIILSEALFAQVKVGGKEKLKEAVIYAHAAKEVLNKSKNYSAHVQYSEGEVEIQKKIKDYSRRAKVQVNWKDEAVKRLDQHRNERIGIQRRIAELQSKSKKHFQKEEQEEEEEQEGEDDEEKELKNVKSVKLEDFRENPRKYFEQLANLPLESGIDTVKEWEKCFDDMEDGSLDVEGRDYTLRGIAPSREVNGGVNYDLYWLMKYFFMIHSSRGCAYIPHYNLTVRHEGGNRDFVLNIRIRHLESVVEGLNRNEIDFSPHVLSVYNREECIERLEKALKSCKISKRILDDYQKPARRNSRNDERVEEYGTSVMEIFVANLENGEEISVPTGYKTGENSGHVVYVSFQRKGEDIIIRVDNLGYGITAAGHHRIGSKCAPYVLGVVPLDVFTRERIYKVFLGDVLRARSFSCLTGGGTFNGLGAQYIYDIERRVFQGNTRIPNQRNSVRIYELPYIKQQTFGNCPMASQKPSTKIILGSKFQDGSSRNLWRWFKDFERDDLGLELELVFDVLPEDILNTANQGLVQHEENRRLRRRIIERLERRQQIPQYRLLDSASQFITNMSTYRKLAAVDQFYVGGVDMLANIKAMILRAKVLFHENHIRGEKILPDEESDDRVQTRGNTFRLSSGNVEIPGGRMFQRELIIQGLNRNEHRSAAREGSGANFVLIGLLARELDKELRELRRMQIGDLDGVERFTEEYNNKIEYCNEIKNGILLSIRPLMIEMIGRDDGTFNVLEATDGMIASKGPHAVELRSLLNRGQRRINPFIFRNPPVAGLIASLVNVVSTMVSTIDEIDAQWINTRLRRLNAAIDQLIILYRSVNSVNLERMD